jgi:hypothetical protein
MTKLLGSPITLPFCDPPATPYPRICCVVVGHNHPFCVDSEAMISDSPWEGSKLESGYTLLNDLHFSSLNFPRTTDEMTKTPICGKRLVTFTAQGQREL